MPTRCWPPTPSSCSRAISATRRSERWQARPSSETSFVHGEVPIPRIHSPARISIAGRSNDSTQLASCRGQSERGAGRRCWPSVGFAGLRFAEDADATISIVRDGYSRSLCSRTLSRTRKRRKQLGHFSSNVSAGCSALFRSRSSTAERCSVKVRTGVGYMRFKHRDFPDRFHSLAPIFDLILVANFLSTARGYLIGDEVAANASMLAVHWLAFQLVDAVLLALAARLDGAGSVWRLAPYLLVQRFFLSATFICRGSQNAVCSRRWHVCWMERSWCGPEMCPRAPPDF